MHLGRVPLNRFLIRDAIVNIAIYLPLGMSGYLTLSPRGSRTVSVLAPVLGGLVLSCCMELIQVFEPARNASALDVATNVAGTVLGVGLGMLFERIAPGAGANLLSHEITDRGALSLVFVWAGYLTFPWFPILGMFGPGHKFHLFLQSPLLAPVAVLSSAAVWFAAGKLLRGAGFGAGVNGVGPWLAPCLLIIPLQLFIVDRQPVLSDLVGAAVGLVIFLLAGASGKVRPVEAVLFLLVILLRGLAPFHPAAAATPFSWIPFGGFLGTEWQSGILILLEKGFYYGTAIWLFRACGWRPGLATATVAVVLAAIEIAQIHLPGRTPEVTDPVLAVLLGFGLTVLSRKTPRLTA